MRIEQERINYFVRMKMMYCEGQEDLEWESILREVLFSVKSYRCYLS